MELSENAQELLEALWNLNEEEAGTDVALSKLNAAEDDLAELRSANLVKTLDGRIQWTKEGQAAAQDVVRRHRLAERLLVDVLATDEYLLEERACRFEHLLQQGVDESICTLLGHPQRCPHGKPIPPGKCCSEARLSVRKLVLPLVEMQPDESGRVAYLESNDSKVLQKLLAMGILPGAAITLIRRSPSYVFQVGYIQFAVDAEIAGRIFVRREAQQG